MPLMTIGATGAELAALNGAPGPSLATSPLTSLAELANGTYSVAGTATGKVKYQGGALSASGGVSLSGLLFLGALLLAGMAFERYVLPEVEAAA